MSKPAKKQKHQAVRFDPVVFERKLRSCLGISSRETTGPYSDPLPSTDDPFDFSRRYLLATWLSKYDDGRSGAQKEQAAMEKFFHAEEVCYWKNWFFSQDNLWIDRTYPYLKRAKEIIHRLLGDELSLDVVARGFGWGPGASTRLPKRLGDACYKFSDKPETSSNAYYAACAAIAACPPWKQEAESFGSPEIVFGSRLTTVPKNYKIDRVIAVEPCMNMYLQKGYGSYLRRRLQSVGIDLDDQSANRFAAKDHSLATIDFSMASDSVSQGLVRYLLPGAHVDFITTTRSELVIIPDAFSLPGRGNLHRLSKVSSMGNGFTFELETLIFWALAVAVCGLENQHRVLVYGDDVLVPVEYALPYLELTKVAGFTPNAEKSFWEGSFRESCGYHDFRGFDVTPFYLKRRVTILEDLFLLHNNLRRWVVRNDRILPREVRRSLDSLLLDLRNLAPAKWRRPRLPDGYGDGAFIGSFAECSPGLHRDCKGNLTGWEYFSIWVLEEDQSVSETEVPGLLVKSLYNLHKRQRVTPVLWESTILARPSSGLGRRRPHKVSVPWAAFG